jgi:predicted CXXCH cytochrome family protein
MRPILLLCALLGSLALLYMVGNGMRNDRNNPQVVPHPSDAMLVVNFAHADHLEQNCVECHHNFVDATGTGMCFDCHKTHTQVAHLIEEQFHDLCRNCHIENQAAGADHGPTRQCVSCHVKDDRP